MEHTPGPWEVTPNGGIAGNGQNVVCNDISTLLNYGGLPIGNGFGEAEANARLIAAAPDLLAALQALRGAFVHIPGDDAGNKVRTAIFDKCPNVRAAINQARAAIERATGDV